MLDKYFKLRYIFYNKVRVVLVFYTLLLMLIKDCYYATFPQKDLKDILKIHPMNIYK